MGYEVHTIDGQLMIKKENQQRGYELVCELNVHDELKRGGAWGGKPFVRPVNSKSLAQDPGKWFAWMPWNYDEVYGNLEEILDALGFYCDHTDEGDLIVEGYGWNKSGQEELFLQALAPLVENGGFLVWAGEDDCIWANCFQNGEMSSEDVCLHDCIFR